MVAAVGAAAPAVAAEDCPDAPQPRVLATGQGQLESVIVDAQGRIFYTDLAGNRLMRLDGPGAEPRMLTTVDSPGGLAFDSDGKLVVGFGNNVLNGNVGDVEQRAGLLKVDPETGASSVYAQGLGMANGVARGPDGAYYASNDFGSNIDRVLGGEAQAGWAKVESGNGLVVDSTGRYLYVAQTFRAAAIRRVEIAAPSNVTEYVRATGSDQNAGPDGMTRDADDVLYVAANGGGQIWKVDRRPAICTLARGLSLPSAVAFGAPGRPFSNRNLYVVGFGGQLVELPGVTTAPPPLSFPVTPQLQLTVRPARTRTGRATKFSFRVLAIVDEGKRPVERALVRFAGKRTHTGADGRATIAYRFSRAGTFPANTVAPGHLKGRTSVAVTAP